MSNFPCILRGESIEWVSVFYDQLLFKYQTEQTVGEDFGCGWSYKHGVGKQGIVWMACS